MKTSGKEIDQSDWSEERKKTFQCFAEPENLSFEEALANVAKKHRNRLRLLHEESLKHYRRK